MPKHIIKSSQTVPVRDHTLLCKTSKQTLQTWNSTLNTYITSHFCFVGYLYVQFSLVNSSYIFLYSAYVVSPGPTCRNSSLFFSFCHSVSNFLGIQLASALVSGSGSDIPLTQDIEPSNSRARLSHTTLRFFS